MGIVAATAVILDLDGTVWDSDSWYRRVAAAPRKAEAVAGGTNAAALLRAAGYTPSTFARACSDPQNRIALYPGVERSLRRLASNGVALGVVTNLPGWIARPMLASTGLTGLFRVLVDYGATSRHKPKPDPLLTACAGLHLNPPGCWYVGDDPNDALAARAAVMPFAWASWGYTASAPDDVSQVLRRPSQLLQLAGVAR